MISPVDSPHPTGRRERKKLETRRALQRAAIELATKHGPDVTIDRICEAADVSPRTFFNHFSAKEEAMIGDPPAPPPDDLLAEYEAGGPTGRTMADLGDVLATHLETSLPSIEQMHLRRHLIDAHPELLPHHLGGFGTIELRLAVATARRQDTVIDDPDAQLVASVATAAMRAAVRRWICGGGDRPVRDHVLDVFARLDAGL